MSRTYKYLDTHYELVDMRGYNKIGDNTFPNLVAALTGEFDLSVSTFQLNSRHFRLTYLNLTNNLTPRNLNYVECTQLWYYHVLENCHFTLYE